MKKFLVIFLVIASFMFFYISTAAAAQKVYGCPYCKVIVLSKANKCPVCDGVLEEVKDGRVYDKDGQTIFTRNSHLCPECGKMQWTVIYSSPACLTKSFDSQKRCPDGRRLTKKEIVGFSYYCPKDKLLYSADPRVCPSGESPLRIGETLETRIEKHKIKLRDQQKEYVPSEGLPNTGREGAAPVRLPRR